MRACVLLLLVLLGGCGKPFCSECTPELRLAWTVDGALLDGDSGEVPLDPVTRGCARNTRLQLRNVGRAAASVSMTTSSPSVTVPELALTVEPGEAQDFDVRVSSPDLLASRVAAELLIDLAGRPSLQFQLHAAVVEVDPARLRSLDFGGVEVGAARALAAPSLTGLTADFSQGNGVLQFSPRLAGPQALAATREGMLDCPDLSLVTVLADGVPAVLTGPSTVNFGDVRVGDGIELDVAVQNLSFDEVQVTPPGADFTIVATSTTPSLATRDQRGVLVPGSRSQRVRFSPAATGTFTGQLEVTAGSRHLVIPLRAVGAP